MISDRLLNFRLCFLFFRNFAFLCNSRQHIFIHFPSFIVENENFRVFYGFCDRMMKYMLANFVHFILIVNKNRMSHHDSHYRHFD
ncbi:hypothetical protein NY2A_b343L [Paramecium bursaria Chlorella virus NY2A]|uniref:Uncharacterized protein b343L n=1 Tax=Paramecium bursaria Chlorella virus NY2A TaxID=46021 RepID=A7IWL8_PBCVN|nr:hypothetical protein NY2A_b343L [Paramecium bursaria Chlorella virus NY2A]YP_001498389.1 hypothetical protein AR158_C308L [Paramecium bursaria Chlorella virus AR158]ABT14742.1 hypothetical protein NY2A_b343L [Paramecium bursaria Chlorella virus NY2A]ABU43853.1 hypothetical protein AR158_C308L [Paramecium bursaria Chlorella virus AR158]